MRTYVLSICFNYYKRYALLKHSIESLLANRDQRLQIVVYDDSTDRQMELFVNSIKDSRLKIVKSIGHAGMVRGMVECISAGDGIYAMYGTEHEIFDCNKISTFIDDLECNQNVGAGFSCLEFSGEYKIYRKGLDAIANIAMQFIHPTGFFFKLSEYKKIDYMKYNNIEKYGYFPLDFLMGELLVQNDGMIYENVWYSDNDMAACLSEDKSFTTKNEADAWFMLDGREKLLKNAILFIEQLPLRTIEKSKILLRQFDFCAEGVSNSLKGILAKELLCRHYCIKSRYLDYKHYSYNLFHVYKCFCTHIPLKYHKYFLDVRAIGIVKKYLIKEV